MNKDPVEWLDLHCAAGVYLREKGRALRADDPVPAWERKAEFWIKELLEGVLIWSPHYRTGIEPLNYIPVEQVKPEHPFYDPNAVDLGMTATGEGQPGNTPLNRLSAAVDQACLILERWRESPPKQHDRSGRKPIDDAAHIELARKLHQEGKSKRAAARIAVEEVGRGAHASEETAIDHIRKHM